MLKSGFFFAFHCVSFSKASLKDNREKRRGNDNKKSFTITQSRDIGLTVSTRNDAPV